MLTGFPDWFGEFFPMDTKRCLAGFLLLLFVVGCAPSGVPVVEVGPEGVTSHSKGKTQTYSWDEIQGLNLSGQLSSENKSYPILRLRTEKSPNIEIASSYSEHVDSKSFAGMYIHLSVKEADLMELKDAVISGAGLTVHPKSDEVWERKKDSASNPPAEKKVYFKSIGS